MLRSIIIKQLSRKGMPSIECQLHIVATLYRGSHSVIIELEKVQLLGQTQGGGACPFEVEVGVFDLIVC